VGINLRSWHIASFRCVTKFGRYRDMADIGEVPPIKLDCEYAPWLAIALQRCDIWVAHEGVGPTPSRTT
jgi:hypothetical protein